MENGLCIQADNSSRYEAEIIQDRTSRKRSCNARIQTLVFGSTQQSARRRIHNGRIELGFPEVLLALHLFQIQRSP